MDGDEPLKKEPVRDTKLFSAILMWIKTARDSYGNPTWLPTPADYQHSALLTRILRGKLPLPFAPPRAFSYPWYALYDNQGDVEVIDVWFRDDEKQIVLEQLIWYVDEIVEQGKKYIVQWRDEDKFLLELKPCIRKIYSKGKKQMVDTPSEGWFIKLITQ